MFKSFFATVTFRQSTLTFSATVVNGLLGLAFFGLLAKLLGVVNFGLFSVIIEVTALVSGIANLGTDTGLVNFISKYKSDPQKVNRFLKVGLFVKLAASLFIIVVGYLLSPFLAAEVFQKPELTFGLRLGMLGAATSLLFSFTTSVLQGYQKFKAWGGVQVITNLLRLILLFFLGSSLLLDSSLILYISMPLFGFFVGFFFISPGFLGVRKQNAVLKEFLHYNKWIAAMALISAFSSRLDIFISARILETSAVGLYAAANKVAYIVPQIVVAIGTVVAPKMAEQTSLKSFLSYFKKTQTMVTGLCLLGLLAIPASLFIFPVLFGTQFTPAIPIFWILLLGMLIFLFSVPVHTAVIYYFSYPKLFFLVAVGHIAMISTLGWYLIGRYGAMGAALAVLFGNLFNFIVPAAWLYRKVSKR